MTSRPMGLSSGYPQLRDERASAPTAGPTKTTSKSRGASALCRPAPQAATASSCTARPVGRLLAGQRSGVGAVLGQGKIADAEFRAERFTTKQKASPTAIWLLSHVRLLASFSLVPEFGDKLGLLENDARVVGIDRFCRTAFVDGRNRPDREPRTTIAGGLVASCTSNTKASGSPGVATPAGPYPQQEAPAADPPDRQPQGPAPLLEPGQAHHLPHRGERRQPHAQKDRPSRPASTPRPSTTSCCAATWRPASVVCPA